MDGKIFDSEGQYVAYIQESGIFNPDGKGCTTFEAKRSTDQRANLLVTSTRHLETGGWLNRPISCLWERDERLEAIRERDFSRDHSEKKLRDHERLALQGRDRKRSP